MKSPAVVVLCSVLALGAGFAIGRFTAPGSSSANTALAEQLASAERRIAELQSPAPRTAAAADGTPPEPDPATPGTTATAENTKAEPDSERNPLQGLAEMMGNPVMKDMMRQQMRGQIAATYAQLFKDQGFAEDEVEALSDLLVDRQLAIMEVSMQGLQEAAGDPEGMKELGKAVAEAKEEYDAQLKELLGESKFDEFERFEQTQGERQQLESLRSQLAGSDTPLSPAQEQQLMDTMWDVRQDPRWNTGDAAEMAAMMQGTGAFPSDADQAVAAYSTMQEEIRQRASGFLDPQQVEALEKNQGAFLDMMKMGIEMGKQMMGAGADQGN